MGNVEGAVVRNVDKRTSRREHRETFMAAVARFREAPFEPPPRHVPASAAAAHSVRVCVRKRPIFPYELEQQEFDAITCLPGRVVIHDARMESDMIHMFMNHHDFAFDAAFGETADNESVYESTARDLVNHALAGGNATVLMYGQTGSGKTHTMGAIYQQAAEELFGFDGLRRTVSCSFIELSGDAAVDVLNHGTAVSLSTASDGSVHPFPCVEVTVEDARELQALVEMAGKLRATAATGVNDQSSRSHALFRAFVSIEGGEDGEGVGPEGCLTLVDLAGSEHRIDSMEHNAERRKEGAKINQSLWALKECIRAMAAGKSVNHRQHKLTHLLHGCFEGRDKHPTVVIATVSPCSKDTEHSLNTLRHACIMDGQGELKAHDGEHMVSGAVTKERLGEIDVTKIARERRAERKAQADGGAGAAAGGDGPVGAHPRHRSASPVSLEGRPAQPANGNRLASDRKALKVLPPRLRQALLDARGVQGGTPQQRRRLGRIAGADAHAHLPIPVVHAPVGGGGGPFSGRRGRGAVSPRPSSCPPRPVPAPALVAPSVVGSAAAAEEERGRQRPQSSAAAAGGLRIPAQSVSSDSDSDDHTHAASSELETAIRLFAVYCAEGRSARDWRPCDLRLINSHVVPVLFGLGTRIDWRHPDAAFEELDRYLSISPAPAHFLCRQPTPGRHTGSAVPRAADHQLPPAAARRRRSLPAVGVLPDPQQGSEGVAGCLRSPAASRPPLAPIIKPRSVHQAPQSSPRPDTGTSTGSSSAPGGGGSPRAGSVERSSASQLSARRMKMEEQRRRQLEDARLRAREGGWQGVGAPLPTEEDDSWNATQMPLGRLAMEAEPEKEGTALPVGHEAALEAAQYSTLAPSQRPPSIAEEDEEDEPEVTPAPAGQMATLMPTGVSQQQPPILLHGVAGRVCEPVVGSRAADALARLSQHGDATPEGVEQEAPLPGAADSIHNPLLVRCQPLRRLGKYA